ncbi:MAG: ABC transporter ATP-binding protein [Treponema sp.]|jgi:peptide/nickel transport system ATP-binding protein|nr:ABC transporter ATP-binding protein [Treponema sp.]
MPEVKSAFLEVKDLTVQYTSAEEVIHAVNGVSFSLERGKTLALVGETGAGKTTIAKSILRILPDHAAKISGGSIFLDGKDLLRLSIPEMRKVRGARIAMVFQDPMTALNPNMKIGDQIAEVIRIHNEFSKGEVRRRTIEMLKMVGITEERYNEYPHQFSGGMKQRVIIAMALACNPELLLADEPTTALDVTIQAQILDMMLDLRNKNNTAMILVTHDLGIVAEAADTVAVIYGGEIVEYGSQQELFDYPAHPYTKGLFGAIPDMDIDVKRLANIDGLPPNPVNLPKGCCFASRCSLSSPECENTKQPVIRISENHFCACWKTGNTAPEPGVQNA